MSAAAAKGPGRLEVVRFTDLGLGNDSYLVVLDQHAIVVDPVRDVRGYLRAAEDRGATIVGALETHLHADFVSGSRALAATGAAVHASADARLAFPHVGLRDGDPVRFGDLVLTAIHTPGHAPEHLAYLVKDEGGPILFSGGALTPGWAARTDLLGDDRTRELARALFRTFRERLAPLPDETIVHPTHGQGSPCAATGGSEERSTTMAEERRANPLLSIEDEDEFVDRLIGGFGRYPSYFHRLREVNRRGASQLGGPSVPSRLSPEVVAKELLAGAIAVDTRPTEAYLRAHLQGSQFVLLDDSFALWLGWTVPWASRLVLVAEDEHAAREASAKAAGIGFDDVGGWTPFEPLVDAGLDVSTTDALGADELESRLAEVDAPTVVDVRRPDEVQAGMVPGARNVEAGLLASEVPADLGGGPVVTYCRSGKRGAIAASLLERAGAGRVAVFVDGAPGWAESGRPLERPR